MAAKIGKEVADFLHKLVTHAGIGGLHADIDALADDPDVVKHVDTPLTAAEIAEFRASKAAPVTDNEGKEDTTNA
jgi:hypothetical protein